MTETNMEDIVEITFNFDTGIMQWKHADGRMGIDECDDLAEKKTKIFEAADFKEIAVKIDIEDIMGVV